MSFQFIKCFEIFLQIILFKLYISKSPDRNTLAVSFKSVSSSCHFLDTDMLSFCIPLSTTCEALAKSTNRRQNAIGASVLKLKFKLKKLSKCTNF